MQGKNCFILLGHLFIGLCSILTSAAGRLCAGNMGIIESSPNALLLRKTVRSNTCFPQAVQSVWFNQIHKHHSGTPGVQPIERVTAEKALLRMD